MKRNASAFGFLALMLAALVGCSSGPSANTTKKAVVLDKIQGKAQVVDEGGGATDAALNAGGSSVYLWKGVQRYRLFLRTPVKVNAGDQYAVEGIYAQKMIDELGDPDQGKNGYPLQASCAHVVGTIWPGLAFDEADLDATALRTVIQRHPARPVFLVTKIEPAPPATITDVAANPQDASAAGKAVPLVEVPAEKERANLIGEPPVLIAPLWQTDAGKVSCPVVIDAKGEVSDLTTGKQLCEAVPWDAFHFKPHMQGATAARVSTEVEVTYQPRK